MSGSNFPHEYVRRATLILFMGGEIKTKLTILIASYRRKFAHVKRGGKSRNLQG